MIYDYTDKFGDLELKVKNVSLETRKDEQGKNTGVWYFFEKFDLDDELIIGMSPTNYHCFVVSGDLEYHPRFSFNANKLRSSRPDSIRAGAFIRIKGIPKRDLRNFRKFLIENDRKRTPSCIEGIRLLLKNGLGIEMANRVPGENHLHEYIFQILKHGLVDRNGRQLELEFYTTRNKTLGLMLHEMRMFSLSFSKHLFVSLKLYSIFRYFKVPVTLTTPKLPPQLQLIKTVAR